MKATRKTIHYRGGIVRFALPSDWVEEYEPDGGGTFYEDRPDSGTLRLSVLGFESHKPAEEAASTVFPQAEAELLPSGFWMRRDLVPAVEEGETIHIHRWEIAIPIPPHGLRLACFTHTVVAGQETDRAIAAELKMVDECIRAAEFGREAGVSGSYYHERGS